MDLNSVLVQVSTPEEVARLREAGADVLDWRGYLPSAEGGAVDWREALVRVPAALAVRLGLVALGEGLREGAEQDGAPTPAVASVATTPPTTVATTSSGVPLIAPRRTRGTRAGRRRRRSIACDTHTEDRTPHAPTPGTMRP